MAGMSAAEAPVVAVLSSIWGAIVAVIVGFAADLVVTTDALREAVADTEVRLLSIFCAREVKESWHGEVPDGLLGWGYVAERKELASEFVPILPGEKTANGEAVLECAERIADMPAG